MTALTDADVSAVHQIPPQNIVEEIRSSGTVDAIKIGMLCSGRRRRG